MPRPEDALRRIVDRLGVERLVHDGTLARTALKDLFPEDPLVVSVLTAAVEHGVIASLREQHRPVPLTVLGPRLADDLVRTTGISDARARWAVAAWAIALRRLDGPLPVVPRDGTDPDVRRVFRPLAGPGSAGGSAEPITDAGPATVTEAVRSGETDREARAATGASALGSAPPDLDAETVRRDEDRAEGTARALGPTARSQATDARGTGQDAQDGDDAAPAGTRATHRVQRTWTAPTDAGATLLRASPAPDDAETTPLAGPAPVPPEPRPAAAGPAPRRSFRLGLLVLAAAVVLAAAGVSAFLLRPGDALTVSGSAAVATATAAGSTTQLRAGSALSPGAEIVVRSGTLQLREASGVVRLRTGSEARVADATTLELRSGRAFVLSDHGDVVVRTSTETATVDGGRALVACDGSGCATTSLDGAVRLVRGRTTTELEALSTARSDGTTSYVVPDAVRADAWFAENDRLDRAAHAAYTGVRGAELGTSWTVSLRRTGLPGGLSRLLDFTTRCGDSGCAVQASSRMADHVPSSPISGTVRALDASGSRFAVDYARYSVRCHYLNGTKKGEGVDGSETATDDFSVTGSGASAVLSGTRTSLFTRSSGICGSAAYTAQKDTVLSGRPGPAAATDLNQAQQQSLLNYAWSTGTGCSAADAMPSAGSLSDVRCGYNPRGNDATSVEFGVYDTTEHLEAAYAAAGRSLGSTSFGDCTVGPCEGTAPDGHGRFRLAVDATGPVLVTYDPRYAHLLVIARGPSMKGLATWWAVQQRGHSVYTSAPIPRVGV